MLSLLLLLTLNTEFVSRFDPARDAAQDLVAAREMATREGKHILLDVGGKWCVWCRYMDRFFEETPELKELRAKNFVVMKVNFSPDNENKEFLGQYPKIQGYPHLFVLDATGKLLVSQETGSMELEKARGYDMKKMRAFLVKWGPKK
ncbi:MAG: thioredoxin family protein [Bryobacteraceae bacterium]|nr:thioredoxin family protein [Bryobacteraceae bacterium]